jgi:hypothetical protein
MGFRYTACFDTETEGTARIGRLIDSFSLSKAWVDKLDFFMLLTAWSL